MKHEFIPSLAQKTVGVVMVVAAFLSLLFWPLPSGVALKLVGIGAVGGLFYLPRDQAVALVGMFIVYMGLHVVDDSVEKNFPNLQMPFWQSAVVTFGAFVLTYYCLLLLKNRLQR
jgi:SNF family Na+-dependent transporter